MLNLLPLDLMTDTRVTTDGALSPNRNIATELMIYEYYFGLLEARYPSRTETGYGQDGQDIPMRFPTGTRDFTQQPEHLWGPPIPYPAGTGTFGAIPPISGKPLLHFSRPVTCSLSMKSIFSYPGCELTGVRRWRS